MTGTEPPAESPPATGARTAAPDARFWNRIARNYARDPIKDMAGYERTIARTEALLGRDASVLELGCGTGTTALRLAPRVGRIVATDAAEGMIAIAREKAASSGAANASFAVGEAADAPDGPDGEFDAVLAFNLLHLVADRAAALAAIRRRLKPGGLFISKTPCLSEMNPLLRLAVPVARLVGKAPRVAFFSASALEREIEGAGFMIVERARHGSGRKDPRIFLVAQRSGDAAPA